MKNRAVLGIDTSNYTTSAALVDEQGNILSDHRIMLRVRPGERGLRQQEALFQHVENLPEVIGSVMADKGDTEISAVSCSVRPRPREGSYMPVFLAGESFARTISEVQGIPLFTFSHQEGHVAAALHGSELEDKDDMVFFHLSGGTTEACCVPGYEMAGGTLDISFGQLIDRAGVAMGMDFPCGREIDELALNYDRTEKAELPKIKVKDGYVNLSGIETACQRYIEQNSDMDKAMFSRSLFERCQEALLEMTKQISEKTGKMNFLFAGGVSSSRYISEKLKNSRMKGITVSFGKPELCRDNAVGIAILGGKKIWR